MQQQYEEEKVSKSKLEQDMVRLRSFYDNRISNLDGQIEKLPTTAEGMGAIIVFFFVKYMFNGYLWLVLGVMWIYMVNITTNDANKDQCLLYVYE